LTTSFQDLDNTQYYPVFGLGLRIHNEHLVFDPFEIRVAYSSAPLPGASEFEISFETAPTFGLLDFTPPPPSVVVYE
jgi:hypothetical protein